MRKQALPAAVLLEAYPADPDFPQLETATDAALMLEVFRAHLKPVAGKTYHIEDCVPFRFRCRQSTSRCVLQYTLTVVDPSTGRARNQWVTGLLYAEDGKAEKLWQEMQAADPHREIPAGWRTFEPVDFIPDLQMVVEVFPYDRRLPNLSRVMNGALRGLEPLLLARFGPGQWHAAEPTIEPTRYRTELGAALKYTMRAREVRTGRSETRHCYLKVYRNQRGEATFRLLRSFSERAGQGRSQYAVVRPLAYLSKLRTLLLEEAPGAPLQQVLLQGPAPEAALRAVGRAVAAFNQDDVAITERHSLADQLADVTRASTLLQWACPQLRAEVRAVTAAVVLGLQEASPAPIHRDLKPDHIYLSGDRVVFIDLDAAALGEPARDAAHLAAHIAARVGLDPMPGEQARAMAAAFVDEYFAHVPASWRDRFPLQRAGALLEVAAGIFKRQEPEWREKVKRAVEQAQRALGGGCR